MGDTSLRSALPARAVVRSRSPGETPPWPPPAGLRLRWAWSEAEIEAELEAAGEELIRLQRNLKQAQALDGLSPAHRSNVRSAVNRARGRISSLRTDLTWCAAALDCGAEAH